MSELRFQVYGSPRAKQRPRVGRGGNVYTPSATRSYEGLVRTHATLAVLGAKGQWAFREQRDVRVTLNVFWPNQRRGDLDNCAKSVLDGCNQTVFEDDRQVVELHCFGAVDADHPRVEVIVSVMEGEAA